MGVFPSDSSQTHPRWSAPAIYSPRETARHKQVPLAPIQVASEADSPETSLVQGTNPTAKARNPLMTVSIYVENFCTIKKLKLLGQ